VLNSERVAYVEVVELLPQVIAWLNRGLFPLAEELKADARLSVSVGDVFDRLSKPPDQKFDLVLIDVDHAPDEKRISRPMAFSRFGLTRKTLHLPRRFKPSSKQSACNPYPLKTS
jgi:hypothetical protein